MYTVVFLSVATVIYLNVNNDFGYKSPNLNFLLLGNLFTVVIFPTPTDTFLGTLLPYLLPLFSGIAFSSFDIQKNIDVVKKIINAMIKLLFLVVFVKLTILKNIYSSFSTNLCHFNSCQIVDHNTTNLKFTIAIITCPITHLLYRYSINFIQNKK